MVGARVFSGWAMVRPGPSLAPSLIIAVIYFRVMKMFHYDFQNNIMSRPFALIRCFEVYLKTFVFLIAGLDCIQTWYVPYRPEVPKLLFFAYH